MLNNWLLLWFSVMLQLYSKSSMYIDIARLTVIIMIEVWAKSFICPANQSRTMCDAADMHEASVLIGQVQAKMGGLDDSVLEQQKNPRSVSAVSSPRAKQPHNDIQHGCVDHCLASCRLMLQTRGSCLGLLLLPKAPMSNGSTQVRQWHSCLECIIAT